MRRGFTLIELMLAILLGAMVVFIIAGSLRTSIKAWEAVEKTSGVNYNRRTVLDLIKRQSSSLFYAEDAEEMSTQTSNRSRTRTLDRGSVKTPGSQMPKKREAFEMPDGASFFKGDVQQLEFVSTVSFLSDFPGQVLVKYYVVQVQPDSEEELKPPPLGEEAPPPPPPTIEESGEEMVESVELEGNLYLAMQETSLFLTQTNSAESEDSVISPEEMDETGVPMEQVKQKEEPDVMDLLGEAPPASKEVWLLGPLRKFTIRYRVPNVRKKDEADDDQDWETTWDVNAANGQYPSAIEYTLFYETPGVTDDVPTEELEGIRMVIPVYSSNNLNQRGNNRAAFFDK